MTVSTLGQNFTQVVFNFKVTHELVVRGLLISIVIGMIGGLLPAIRAARLPVTTGLREL
jgi:putative ABC transport system permease protein